MADSRMIVFGALVLAISASVSAQKGAASATKEIAVTLPRGALMEMVWIPPGMFWMGSPDTDGMAVEGEKPQHQVTISKGFYLAKYELTQGQYESVMGPFLGSMPQMYYRRTAQHALVGIAWQDVQSFIARLNKAEQAQVYRLPTEAEWEYACRAGTTTPWFFGEGESQLGEYAWYKGNESEPSDWNGEGWNVRVGGQKKPNPWGLYDMYGNVAEWVQDRSGPYVSGPQVDLAGPPTGKVRVLRGGSYLGRADQLRSASRGHYKWDAGDGIFGARLVRQEP